MICSGAGAEPSTNFNHRIRLGLAAALNLSTPGCITGQLSGLRASAVVHDTIDLELSDGTGGPLVEGVAGGNYSSAEVGLSFSQSRADGR